MSRLLARIMLAILMLPAATIVFTIAAVFFGRSVLNARRDGDIALLLAGGTTFLAIILYWVLLWRRSIRWNRKRITLTFVAILAAMVVGVFVGGVLNEFENGFGTFVGTFIAPLLWLIATVFIWRETTAERIERVRSAGRGGLVCPTCGYNLTGLSSARCPECGSQFTLDELVASQPAAVSAELE